MMQGGGGGMMGGGMMGLGWLIGLLIIVLLIVGIVALVMIISRSSGASGASGGAAQQPASQPDAMETLRQRFARGEMSREEFEQAREALRQP